MLPVSFEELPEVLRFTAGFTSHEEQLRKYLMNLTLLQLSFEEEQVC